MMRFISEAPISKDAALAALQSGDRERICHALASVALYENDWRWAQGVFLKLLDSSDEEVSALSATCLGHLARIHRKIDKDIVIPALRAHLKDIRISGIVSDALDDVDMFA